MLSLIASQIKNIKSSIPNIRISKCVDVILVTVHIIYLSCFVFLLKATKENHAEFGVILFFCVV